MPADTVLVIDAGTSALRAVAVRCDGRVTPLAAEAWPMFVPEDAAASGREFDVAALRCTFERLIAAATPARDVLAGLAFTGQREGIAFLDEQGAAVFASPNIDARASAEGISIDAAQGADVYAVTGHLPSLMQAPAKLAWLRSHRPAVAERVAHMLPLSDWLATLATGTLRTSRSLAVEHGVLDVTSGAVPVEPLRRVGFDAGLVARVAPDGSISGEVTAGVMAGLPVVLAGADTQCALLGMGAIDAGAAGLAAGWSAPLQLVTAGPVFDRERRTWTGVHVAPQRWILESNAGELGRAFDWICSMMNLAPGDAANLAAGAPVGSSDAMSVLGPRAMRASEMSAGVGGLTFPLPLVMSAPGRAHLLRSVLEATAYAVRANMEQLEEVSGARIASLAIGGGMSRSHDFCQIVTDVIDRPLAVAAVPETSAVGAAALAAVAVGLHATLADAVRAMTAGGRVLTPNPRISAAYDDYYARWCDMCDAFERIAGL